jgi:hypothetical protein
MRHALASFLVAVPICAFAAPALAQDYGPAGPVGAVIAAPFNAVGGVVSAPFGGWPQDGMTVASKTGAPTYSYSTMPPSPAPIGHCDIVSGNRVCFATP